MNAPDRAGKRPNILMITVDQLRFPRFSYGPDHGFIEPLKFLLGFQNTDDPEVEAFGVRYFPGLSALRRNAVVLRNHTIATSACIPSRTALYTGQYGTRTGVTQTDGAFKNGDSSAFPWLAAGGIPTLGHWLREAGYATHYFGKWHVSNPPEHSLRRYGFDDWELSYPEPHGSQRNNLGFYRDYEFADLAVAYLRRCGLASAYTRECAQLQQSHPYASDLGHTPPVKPWFAVVSFTNPHDIAAYPTLPGSVTDTKDWSKGEQLAYLKAPLGVPAEGWRSQPPQQGSFTFPMNPRGFPHDCAHSAANQDDDLKNKPSCQYDYSYKMGLALAAKTGWAAVKPSLERPDQEPPTELYAKAARASLATGLPFQLNEKPDAWALAFLRYYAYLQHVVDQHIARVLEALRDSGQADDTIVLFLSDHGEYGAAHGLMMEKWHTAYQEAVHVPVVIHGPIINRDTMPKQVDALTSHIDILPTVLGLAGLSPEAREAVRNRLWIDQHALEPVGADLSKLILAAGAREHSEPADEETITEGNGRERRGVLFITDDEITEPLDAPGDPHGLHSMNEYRTFLAAVDQVRTSLREQGRREIEPGPVVQPNHVRCVRTRDWKLVRYWDPAGKHADEWELYDLASDPNELTNLLVFDGEFPTVIREPPASAGSRMQITARARELHALLGELEATLL